MVIEMGGGLAGEFRFCEFRGGNPRILEMVSSLDLGLRFVESEGGGGSVDGSGLRREDERFRWRERREDE